jgi:colanic acid biosynthesis glycosyl transferase WcaI
VKILIYTMYFSPEPVGIAPMATDLAEYLAGLGWDVTVVAGMPKLPAWEAYEGYRGKWFLRETRGRVKVLRARIYIPKKPAAGQMPAWRRVLHDSSVVVSGVPLALTTGRPDLLLSISPPLQLAAAAIGLSAVWRCPVVNWIQDIVPDAALNVGMMREGFAVRLARRLERFVYDHADRLAVIAEGLRSNLLKKGVPAEKISLATNWADEAPFEGPFDRQQVRAEWGVGAGDFVLMYGGSFAAKQVLENVVRAMKLLDGHPHIRCFLVGDGIRKSAIRDEIAKSGARVSVVDLAGPVEYGRMLRAADLLILNQSRDLIDALIPSKLLTYLLAERPVVAAVNEASEAAEFMRAAGCGRLVEPEDPGALAETILQMRAAPDELRRMGESGRRYVLGRYTKDIVLSRFAEFLKSQYHS